MNITNSCFMYILYLYIKLLIIKEYYKNLIISVKKNLSTFLNCNIYI